MSVDTILFLLCIFLSAEFLVLCAFDSRRRYHEAVLHRQRAATIYGYRGLTFWNLRAANVQRLPLYKDKRGECPFDSDGGPWLLSQWSNALGGEFGEAANIIKKIERGDFTLQEAKESLAKELADIVDYTDLLAHRAGIDLGKAVASKFNEVSRRVGANVFLPEE